MFDAELKRRAAAAGALEVATIAMYAHVEHAGAGEAALGLIKSLAVDAEARASQTAMSTLEGVVETLQAGRGRSPEAVTCIPLGGVWGPEPTPGGGGGAGADRVARLRGGGVRRHLQPGAHGF